MPDARSANVCHAQEIWHKGLGGTLFPAFKANQPHTCISLVISLGG